ncbi:MAG: hypothetical protein DRJ13_05290 [Bacteroidetes bacterium]|nr:MAG: hypothetical protein DRJ13_05290 [Bacteroidota bacterium]
MVKLMGCIVAAGYIGDCIATFLSLWKRIVCYKLILQDAVVAMLRPVLIFFEICPKLPNN